MIVVTGAAGFIGSNLVHALNAAGHTDILAVDDLTDGTKFANLAGAKITDYQDKDEFLAHLAAGTDTLGPVEVVFHQGACSSTTEWNGKFMMDVNYRYSKTLLAYCRERGIPFIYASSASVYGSGKDGFTEDPRCEHPLNVYAYSKLLFDQGVRRELAARPGGSQVVGLRYFNVYGPREAHKGGMASVAMHLRNQLREGQEVRLFEGSDGYGPGEQKRDFVHVDDVVALNLWFWRHPEVSGIFNAGTGRAETFNDVAFGVLGWHGRGRIAYIAFPDKLKGRYQAFTEADLTALRAAGCQHAFADVATGVERYMDWLGAQDGERRPTV